MTIDAVQQLTDLLREAKAVPRLRAEAVMASAIYDPVYRATILALTLHKCGKTGSDRSLSLADPKLKLFQFVAVHRHLLPSLRGWVRAHAEGQRPSLDGWALFPRGYAADSLYERLVTYLVATGELRRDGNNLVGSFDDQALLGRIIAAAETAAAFQQERATLAELGSTQITLGMLRA